MALSTVPAPTRTRPEPSPLQLQARRQSRRRDIYYARDRARAVTSLKRVRHCGWAPRSDEGVTVRVVECEGIRRAGLGNVQTCGSFWACPVCSEKIAATRQAQIEQVLRWWAGPMEGAVALVTMTVAHKKWQRLRTVFDVVSECWAAVTSGAAWVKEQRTYGAPQLRQIASGKRKGEWVCENRIRSIRIFEVTHGRNGWHVHVHALLLLDRSVTDATVEALGRSMWRRWSARAARSGMEPTGFDGVGVDVKLLHGDPSAAMGDYFVKAAWSASWETAGGMRKESKNGNRTPFAILRDVVEPPVDSPLEQADEDLSTWAEYEEVTKGRRAIAFSAGLLFEAGFDAAVAEMSDEDIVEQDALDGETVATIPPLLWRELRRGRGICDLLDCFEDSTTAGLAMLSAWSSLVDADLRPVAAG